VSATDEADPARPAGRVAVFAPVLLLLIEIHCSADDRAEVHLHAGGQGYWVARMVQALGAEALLCGPAGGEPGDSLRAVLGRDGLPVRLTPVEAANSVLMEDRRDGRETLVQTPIPALGRHEGDELYSTTVGAAIEAGVCVLCGAQGVPAIGDDTFRRLAHDLRVNGVRVVADLSGGPLRAALAAGVDVLKVSHEELVRDGLARSGSVEAVAEAIGALREAGAKDVVVSRSERSTVASLGDRLVEVRAPALEVVDHRGGGDSMTAALAAGVAAGLDHEQTLRLAAAAGALNVSRHGLGTGRRDTIEQMASRVTVHEVGPTGPVPDDPTTWSRAALYEEAQRLDVRGRSRMTRDQLLASVLVSGAGSPPKGRAAVAVLR
jgi:1-phosphofructokinase